MTVWQLSMGHSPDAPTGLIGTNLASLDTDYVLANQVKMLRTMSSNAQGLFNNDGYPKNTGSLTVAGTRNIRMLRTYCGKYRVRWDGTGAFFWNDNGIVVFDGGALVGGLGTNTGVVSGSLTIAGAFTSPSYVEFAFGSTVTAVSQGASNGAGGNYIRLTMPTAMAGSWTSASTGTLCEVTGCTSSGGTINGTWQGQRISTTTVDLLGSLWDASMTAGASALAIRGGAGDLQTQFPASRAYTDMSGMIWARVADYAGCVADQNMLNPDFVSRYQQLNMSEARLMDICPPANNSNWTDATKGNTLTGIGYMGGMWRDDLWSGNTSNSGDDFTSDNPSSAGVGAYQSGEQVQLRWNASATGNSSRLQLGSRGFKPIIDAIQCGNKMLRCTGAVSSGDTFTLTFDASWLNGGSTVTIGPITGQTTTSGVIIALAAAMASTATAAGRALLGHNVVIPQGLGTSTFFLNYPIIFGAITFGASTSGAATFEWGNILASAIVSAANATLYFDTDFDAWIKSPSLSSLSCSIPVEIGAKICNALNTNMWWNSPHCMNPTNTALLAGRIDSTLNENLVAHWAWSNETWNFGFVQYYDAMAKGVMLSINPTSFTAQYTFHALQSKRVGDAVKAVMGSRFRTAVECQMYFGTSAQSNQLYKLEGGCAAASPAALTGASISGTTLSWTGQTGRVVAGLLVTGVGVAAGTRIYSYAGGTSASVTVSQSVGPISMSVTNDAYVAYGYSDYNVVPNRPIDDAIGPSVAPYWQGAQFLGNQTTAWPSSLTNLLNFGGPSPDTNGAYSGLLGAIDDYEVAGTWWILWCLWDRRYGMQVRTGLSITASNSGGDLLLTRTSHSLQNGDMLLIGYAAGGSICGNVTAGENLYAVSITANTFKVSRTLAGTPIAWSSAGSSLCIGSSNGVTSTASGLTLDYQKRVVNPQWITICNSYSPAKIVKCYEGGDVVNYAATCTGLDSSYLGTAGRISLMNSALKKTPEYQAFVEEWMQELLDYSAPWYENWYYTAGNGTLNGSPFSLQEIDLYGTFFKSFDAIAAINNA